MAIALDKSSLIQSAGAFAAGQVASRVSPRVLAKAGRAVGAIQSVLEFVNGPGAYYTNKTPLLGGISLEQAKAIHDQVKNFSYAKKNFFIVQVGHLKPPKNGAEVFNTFATEVSYSPYSISGGSRPIGAASFDEAEGVERAELRITTLDDTEGSLKRWYREIAGRVANRVTGTVGVPASYALTFTVYHAVVAGWDEGSIDPIVIEPYLDIFHMRPSSSEVELSRRDPSTQELQMTFCQIDSFMLGDNAQRI